MIFICVKFTVKPEYADTWLEEVSQFTRSTRAEPGNLWFEWSRSAEDPNQFVLLESFADDAAEAHVNSDHFAAGLETMRPMIARTPQIINFQTEGNDWSEMGELKID